MPLLDTRWRGSFDVPLHDEGISHKDDALAAPIGPEACLCGARLPLQVRLGLRSRTRPVLEGRWCCSDACLRARVASFVRLGLPKQGIQRKHRHRVPLGLLLVNAGSISPQQLRHALEVSQHSEERVGEVLVRDCGLSELTLANALAQQWGCGSWDLRGLRPESAACFAPLVVLERTGMLPIRELKNGRLGVAFATDLDTQAIFALQRIHNRHVDAGIAIASHVAEARDRLRNANSVATVERYCTRQSHLVREVASAIETAQPVEGRWARLHNIFWLRLWLEPAAILGGPSQREDVVDHIFHLPENFQVDTEA